MMSTEREVEIIRSMFDTYVEFVAASFMCGEVPSSVFAIHSRGTKDNDWLATVKFKNSLTISMFRCEVYLEDLVRLCRRCKFWLITEPVLEVVSLYFMLHPLLQTQNLNFAKSATVGYESMLAGAGDMTYKFISKCFHFSDPVQRHCLEVLRCHNILSVNLPYSQNKSDVKELMDYEWCCYKQYMLEKYPAAYRKATHFKASGNIVDELGFIHISKRPVGNLEHSRKESVEDVLKLKGDLRRKNKKAFSITPERKKQSKMELKTVDENGFYRFDRKQK